VILAGLVDDKLAGYIVTHAIDGTAYVEKAYYLTEFMSTNISTGLLYEFLQVCRRSPGIHEVVHGLHSIERPSLTWYKTSLGFPVVHLPSKIDVNPLVAALLRWRRPDAYYRLTGSAVLNLTAALVIANLDRCNILRG
jgi:hypothetical protein